MYAQTTVCGKQTIFNFDFGSAGKPDMNLSFLANYRPAFDDCPGDGYYTFTGSSYSCFGGNWHNIAQDHTPGDINGKMMLVNSSYEPGEFFLVKVKGLRQHILYEISAWIVNVCRQTVGCQTVFPNIDFVVKGTDGRMIAKFTTGTIEMEPDPVWKRYSARFNMPASAGDVVISMINKEVGGCGNDIAIDDILLTSCETILPVQPTEKPVPTVTKPESKVPVKQQPVPAPVKKDTFLKTVNTIPRINTPVPNSGLKNPVKTIKPQPIIIKERSNPVVKQIFTDSAELLVEVYDNGVIDGDTVSIYHNNELVIAKAALSAKPISLRIRCDAAQPHHELVMVAHNLGSIPPNTSLMIVTAGEQRYEVFISSDNKKNAKVLVEYRKK
jgi:hypothetical protein